MHLYLQKRADGAGWTMKRPDRTTAYFDADGYQTAMVDKNGNQLTFHYQPAVIGGHSVLALTDIVDATGRRTLTLDYAQPGDTVRVFHGTTKKTVHQLSDLDVVGRLLSITDVIGRKITFTYGDDGTLRQITDGAGGVQPKNFTFTYDKKTLTANTKLVRVTDPVGHASTLSYGTVDDSRSTRLGTLTDRRGKATTFAYGPAAAGSNGRLTSTVTDANGRATRYVLDAYGRPLETTNAKSQVTRLSWDADNNVVKLVENNGATRTWRYDPKTGYPLEIRSAEANKNDYAGTRLTYNTGLDGHVADLATKTSPEGRKWVFGYDGHGNLVSVTDPKGSGDPTKGDYTTRYVYDGYGQLVTVTDANGHSTRYGNYDPSGYPRSTTDPFGCRTVVAYDVAGDVVKTTDADQHTSTYAYDLFKRPVGSRVPKDSTKKDYIVTPAPLYDANDNVLRVTAPNGAVSTAVYDAMDKIVAAVAPKDSPADPERRTTYTYDNTGHLLTATEPKGTATADNPGDYVTRNQYNEIYQLISTVNALGDRISYQYDGVGNLITVVDPKKNKTPDATDFSTKSTYDLDHRVTQVADALGKTTKRAYDKDSLIVSTTDAMGATTLTGYDERGKKIKVRAPYEGAGSDITYRTTTYEYDQVGNVTKVTTPRGTDTERADDFASRTEYDAMNRPVKQFQPYDPADDRYKDPNVYTQTVYDRLGRVAKTSLPPSEGQTVRSDTTNTYFDNGWIESSTDPWDIATTYDYNELGQQTSRTLTSAGGSSSRTMGWSYYPNGKLKEKTDDGVPVGSAVALVDNSDVQNTGSTGTWTTGSVLGQQGYDHQVHPAGAGTDAFTWTLNVPRDGKYTVYAKFPQVSGAATNAKYTITHASGTTDKTIDQAAGAGAWVSLGSYDFTQGNQAKLELFENSGGVVVADAVKLVRDNSGDTDTEKHHFRYAYDVNGNLKSIDDSSSGAKIDSYTIAYTELNQVRSVTEALGGQDKRTTSYTYDADSQPETVTHPDQFSEYTYDPRELAQSVSIGKSASDTSPKASSYSYTDNGKVLRETKPNGNTVDNSYFLNGAVKTNTEKKSDGTLVDSHDYAYDANGNMARDVAKKMNADSHSAYLDSTTAYSYDPVDRIAKVVKTGNGAGTQTYVHDDNANVISQTVGGTSTTFGYDRNRLQTSTTQGTKSSYNYDPFGRQESVSRGGQIVSRSIYDGFDHVIESQQRDGTGAMKSTKYAFDPLDRTTSKTSDGKTTDYTYLGLSNAVLNEEVAGKLSKSYQYSPWGQRLSQVTHKDDGTTEDAYYGYNAHTNVETLTDKNGDTKATYGYTAYGSDDKSEFTGIDKPDVTNPTKEDYNSYRFNAKRWDPNSGTYDMGFRNYDPGLNRFTTRDMYNGALDDLNLGSDPFTGNRYAFTGGNPISNVEIDGHFALLALAAVAVAALEVVAVVLVVAVVVLAVAAVAEKVKEKIDENAQEKADEEEKPEPRKPRPLPRDNKKGKCGSGWVDYGDTDASNGNRSTGITACLTQDYLASHQGSETDTSKVTPPGYRWAQRAAGFLGAQPVQQNINACHLLGKQLSGSGTDTRNLATCARGANDWQTGSDQGANNMKNYENQVKAAVDAGQEVSYSVTPLYSGNRTVPTGFQLTANGTNPDGTPGLQIDQIVPNTLRGQNLGTFNDPNTGAPVPTGGMP